MHKLRLVFYEAEKIKRFDWLIYPSRLLLSSFLREPSVGINSFVRGHERLDFVFLFRMLRCEGDNLYRLKRESEEGVRARAWT